MRSTLGAFLPYILNLKLFLFAIAILHSLVFFTSSFFCIFYLTRTFLFNDNRVAFFSADAIPAKVELCYDYGYYEGNVEGKSRKCLCGAIGCRNVLY